MDYFELILGIGQLLSIVFRFIFTVWGINTLIDGDYQKATPIILAAILSHLYIN